MNLRRLTTDERGLTLPELMVAVFLMTIISIVFTSVLSSSLTATKDIEGAARSNDDIRLTLIRIDRELRGAETICEPLPGDASNRLSFITSSTTDASGSRHVVYELVDRDGDGNNTDLVRSIDGGLTFDPVLSTIANEQMALELGVPQFLYENQGRNELDATGTPVASPSYGKVVAVRVWVDSNLNDRISPQLETTEVAGRNVWTPNAANC